MNGIEPGSTVHHVAGTFPEWFDDVLSYIIPTAVFFVVLLSTLVTTDTVRRLCTVDTEGATTVEYSTPSLVWCGILVILLGLVLLDVVGQTVCNLAHYVIKNWMLVPFLRCRYISRINKRMILAARWGLPRDDSVCGIERPPRGLLLLMYYVVVAMDWLIAFWQWILHGRPHSREDELAAIRKSMAEIDIALLRYENLPEPYDISGDFGAKMKQVMRDGVIKLHFRLLILGCLREYYPRLAGYLSKKFARARAARSMAFYWLLLFVLLWLFKFWSPGSVERSLVGEQADWTWLLIGSAALFILYMYIYYRRQYWFGRYVLMSYLGAKQGFIVLRKRSESAKAPTAPTSPEGPGNEDVN